MKHTLGILGGMGPLASARFYELLIKKSIEIYHVERNKDFPHIILDSIPVPDLITSKKDEAETVRMIEKEAKRLVGAGATLLAMPCNTMHLYADKFQSAAGVPFLSMIEAVMQEVESDNRKRVGLLGSITTMQSDLYKPLLSKGIELVIPTEMQSSISSLIHEVIAGQTGENQQNRLHEFVHFLAEKGCDSVILGCTELPLLSRHMSMTLPVYDSLEILAKSCCKALFSN